MCIVFTCGEHTFRKEVAGYEGVVCRCFNCGNYSGHVLKTHPWFTLCFVPVIPLSIHGYEDVTCHICNFSQPLEHRQDVQSLRHGAGGPGPGPGPGGPGGPVRPAGPGGGVPMQPQGYSSQPPGQTGAMRYG